MAKVNYNAHINDKIKINDGEKDRIYIVRSISSNGVIMERIETKIKAFFHYKTLLTLQAEFIK